MNEEEIKALVRVSKCRLDWEALLHTGFDISSNWKEPKNNVNGQFYDPDNPPDHSDYYRAVELIESRNVYLAAYEAALKNTKKEV
jgi:hypothetical protein